MEEAKQPGKSQGKKVTVVLPSEAPFCCPVSLKAVGFEPQPRDKGLFFFFGEEKQLWSLWAKTGGKHFVW